MNKEYETIANEVNATVENIGARRLHTIIEKVLDEISFTATDRGGEKIIIDKNYVTKNLERLLKILIYQNLFYNFIFKILSIFINTNLMRTISQMKISGHFSQRRKGDQSI